MASGKKHGYMYTYTPGPMDKGGVIVAYTVTAQPDTYGETGKKSYFTDQTGVIRETQEDRAATAKDPPVSD